jgi:mono/diheme cytochrome c family protein
MSIRPANLDTLGLRAWAVAGFALATGLALGAAPAAAQDASAPDVDFQRQVRPILADNCFQCHGPDESTRQVRLRLDTEEGAFGERPNGRPIVRGDAEASLVFRRITHANAQLRMPPADTNKTLSAEQVDILRRWIDEGASWDQHWAFKPVLRPDLPAVSDGDWERAPLDRFVLARLESEGLAPAPEADRRTLARRAALDLTGLPPDPALLDRFLNDPSEDAYEQFVDELLATEQWGEHRARYWLDAARYGDTHGIHIDNYREMYPYRDWVIRAFNENKRFDEFTVEQVAGDLLPEPSLDQLVASGFQRNNITTNEGGVVPEEYEAIYAKDRAETIGNVFLGLTVGCATCHDHKFDPIRQSEFYAMTAFFRNTTQYVMDGNVSDPPPILVVPREDDRQLWNSLREEAADVEVRLAHRAAAVDTAFAEWLATGEHQALRSPLEDDAQWMRLDLGMGSGAVFELDGQRHPVTLEGGAQIEAGPHGHAALRFADESWAGLPPTPLDTDTPFSIALWIYQPEEEGNYVVAGQYDADDANRGWSMNIGSRQLSFRMTGEPDPDGEGRPAPSVAPSNLRRLSPGEWTHIVITHDGTGERAGMNVFRNGDVVEASGSEYFTRAIGSIRTGLPLELGRGRTRGRGGRDELEMRYFSGGGIADLRVFNRPLTAQEAKVVSLWATLEGAREKHPDALDEAEREALRLHYLSVKDEQYRGFVARSQEIEREWREVRRRGGVTHVMNERADSEAAAHVLNRGMYDQPLGRVVAGTPAALPPMEESWPRNRLGLARWLVDEGNPLTSRVTANRFWQQVFGTGLVTTSEDFGAQGDPPTHPELLDWLAVEFRESDWDVKQFFRTLVTSATYRQAALATPEKLESDPDNRLFSRGPRFRMDAEMVRDYALASSGLLVGKIGGPSVRPYQPAGVWSTVAMPQSNTRLYRQDEGEALYRRSLYTFWKRSAPPPSLEIFNAPTREHSVVRRERTNTPLQALVTMNDPQFVEAARYLAQRAMRQTGGQFDAGLDFVTLRLLARRFNDVERDIASRSFEGLVNAYRADAAEADRLLHVGESLPDAGLPAAESAAWTMLVTQVMNLDEVLNK